MKIPFLKNEKTIIDSSDCSIIKEEPRVITEPTLYETNAFEQNKFDEIIRLINSEPINMATLNNMLTFNNQRIVISFRDIYTVSQFLPKSIIIYRPIKEGTYGKNKEHLQETFDAAAKIHQKQTSCNIECLKSQIKYLKHITPFYLAMTYINPNFCKNIAEKKGLEKPDTQNFVMQKQKIKHCISRCSDRISPKISPDTALKQKQESFSSLLTTKEFQDACLFEDNFFIEEVNKTIELYKDLPEEKRAMLNDFFKKSYKTGRSFLDIVNDFKVARKIRSIKYHPSLDDRQIS